MKIFEILGLVAALVQLWGYYSYYRYVRSGDIVPSTGSWVIWGYGNVVVCLNYIILFSDRLSFVGALPIACAAANILLVAFLFGLKKFQAPRAYELVILFADVAITCFWIFSKETMVTHILLQVSVLISFIPILKETRKDPSGERPEPWVIWSAAYLLLLFAEYGSVGPSMALVYPAHYLFWHVIMALTAKEPKPST